MSASQIARPEGAFWKEPRQFPKRFPNGMPIGKRTERRAKENAKLNKLNINQGAVFHRGCHTFVVAGRPFLMARTAMNPTEAKAKDLGIKEPSTASTVHGQMGLPVLDACCGSRMFWFDRFDPRCVFVDQRRETHELPDKSSPGGSRFLVIDPDIQADFTNLPFAAATFSLVVFDPPHLIRSGRKSWLAKKYGKLEGDWRWELKRGFAECFRVLKPEGTLVFKWNEQEVSLNQILALTPERPLFGNRGGKAGGTHWVVFLKPSSVPNGNEVR